MNGQELLNALVQAQANGRDLNDLAIIISEQDRETQAVFTELDPTENTLVIFTR
jgi:hypothetical protein